MSAGRVDSGKLSENILICETCELNRNDLFDAKMAASMPARVRRDGEREREKEIEASLGKWPVRRLWRLFINIL